MFNFNPDKHGVYIGRGYCVFHEETREPDEQCEDFICRNYEVETPE